MQNYTIHLVLVKQKKIYPLCLHKACLLFYLHQKNGEFFWDTIRNHELEQNQLLKSYGYSLKDDWKSKFEFNIINGQVFLKVLDSNLKHKQEHKIKTLETPAIYKEQVTNQHIVFNDWRIVIHEAYSTPPFFKISLIQAPYDIENGVFTEKIKVLEIQNLLSIQLNTEEEHYVLNMLRKFFSKEWLKKLLKKYPFEIDEESFENKELTEVPHHILLSFYDYFLNKIQILFQYFSKPNKCFLLPSHKKLITQNLQPIHISVKKIFLAFVLEKINHSFVLNCFIKLGQTLRPLMEFENQCLLYIVHKDAVYIWESLASIEECLTFMHEVKVCLPENIEEFYYTTVFPLSQRYEINLGDDIKKTYSKIKPKTKIVLIEFGDIIQFRISVNYFDKWYDIFKKDPIILVENDSFKWVYRNENEESKILNFILSLHPNFNKDPVLNNLSLTKEDVLKNSWFLYFFEQTQLHKIQVTNDPRNQKLKLNYNTPKKHLKFRSEMNWFEADLLWEINNQSLSLLDLKYALEKSEGLIQLKDGTIGYISEPWQQNLKSLFSIGKIENNKLKINHIHHTIIEELYDNNSNPEIEIINFENFVSIKDKFNIQEIAPPHNLKISLRPYQIHGFQWLNYLTEIGFGGLLADDMGLGKTVQVLSIFLHHFNKNKSLNCLVICPYTLLFNWEKELGKFTKDITYIIYHGNNRHFNLETLKSYNIIFTSYGTIRSDYKKFAQIPFDFIVLDESQIIKNPHSIINKSILQLQSKYKFCLSGTPIQNNSFDLYSQMNFLNPGLLNSYEDFAKKFATPIDKHQNEAVKQHLKKIVYPFILRRTKVLVAPDLPAKLDEILLCDMGPEQRKIYETHRMIYKDKIYNLLQHEGIQKSKFSILQGLMKLRQICDSPYLIGEGNKKALPESIKITTLIERLPEHLGEHKVLIFSQFLDMLWLVKNELDALNISYLYLDGKQPIENRKNMVTLFQEEPEPKIFLISLKTGGLGVNLTAADYVYIVDPWWNPAVEEQAIDRTHRIGQTKQVFSYRLICKNTIEEKILHLQERKKTLIGQILEGESGFMKSLTKDDIDYLFS